MSFLSLTDLPYTTLAGFTLNLEETSTLTTSLTLKRQQEKLDDIWLWGKVLGVHRDYYIAQAKSGGEKEDWFARRFYYSMDMINWLQLPDISPAEMQRIEAFQGRFYGDPAYEYPVAAAAGGVGKEPDDAESEAEQPPPINEEKRLSGTVHMINHETEIVPRGAYYRDQLHELRLNPSFKGLSQHDLPQITSYFHFRPGFDINTRTILERANTFDENIDVFESIDRDEPRGVWSIQTERGGSVAILRNLLWPGYVFFHAPSPSPRWGAMYYGTGQKNHHIGFML